MRGKLMGFALLLSLFATGFTFGGWQNQVSVGNREYQNGQLESAIATYQEGLVDAPEEPVIHYNLGNALYDKGDFARASEHFTKTMQLTENRTMQTQAEYNLGNATYREGVGLAQSKPEEAVNKYEAALQHFQNVMKNDPPDQDAKYNYEFVKKQLKDLQDKMQNDEENHDQGSDEGEGNSQDGDQEQEQKQGDSGDQNGEEDQAGQDAEESGEDQQEQQQGQSQEDQQNQDQQQGQQSGEESQDEQQSGQSHQPEQETGDESQSGMTSEELPGLTEAQALQLLEQFADEGGEFIPVQVQGEDTHSGKDW